MQTPGHDDVDAAVRAWRADATNVVVAILAVGGGLLLILLVTLGKHIAFPFPHFQAAAAAYGLVVASLAIPRRRYRWRATVLVGALYVIGLVQLATNGLVGSGRVTLLAVPILATILLGAKAGWITAWAAIAVMALVALIAPGREPADWERLQSINHDQVYWGIQLLLLVIALIPLTTLLSRFLALHKQTLVAERRARADLGHEAARRRELEAAIVRIGEDERRRLGAELHDGLCQHLTAALLHCTAVEDELSEENHAIAGRARRLRALLEESIGMAYDASKGLCPVDPSPDALVSALERLARQTRASTGIVCEFLGEGNANPGNPQQALQLFRIAQEAVTNAVRHSAGQTIKIRLERGVDAVVLSVEDDGVGRHDDEHPGVGGMGVQLMKYRADGIGGTLSIDHPKDRGTLVTCRAPVDAPDPARPAA